MLLWAILALLLTKGAYCYLVPSRASENGRQLSASSDHEMHPKDLPQPAQSARIYLAERLRIPPARVQVVQVEHKVWRDGCFELSSRRSCAPAEVPGFRVTLQVSEKRYVYHTDVAERFMFAGSSPVRAA